MVVQSLSSARAGTVEFEPRAAPIRVLLVDDHGLFRRGLELILQQESDIEVVGEASDGAEAARMAVQLEPDVVLLDVRMPRRHGIEACSAIRSDVPTAKIVILTVSDEEEDLFEAVKAGASGYLLKSIPVDEVAASVRAVHEGQSLIPPSMASKLLSEFATIAKRKNRSVPAPRLTGREMEVLQLVARGLANRDIAEELCISDNTVKNHVRNILEKLQLHSRMQAAMYAVREKLFDEI
ncbi:MAG: response regulator [Streptosporangiaceae bacterium]